MDLLKEINGMGIILPTITKPGGNYVSTNVRGKIAYVAIQFPIRDEVHYYRGILGKNLSTKDGVKAMELCALNILAQVHHKIGFEKVEGLNHIDAYFQSAKDWDDSPIVVNGASDLFVKVLGSQGTHTRAIFGVHNLPRNFSVGLTASFTLHA